MASAPQSGHSHLSPFPQQAQQMAANVVVPESSAKKTPLAACRHGQELVQEVVHKTYEILNFLKSMQLPPAQQVQDRKARLEDLVHRTEAAFQKLHFVYESTSNVARNFDPNCIDNFLVGEDGTDEGLSDEQTRSEEERKLIEQIRIKNQHIKEIVDVMRKTVWKVDSVVMFRKSGFQ